jgi:hypothetical protein
VVSSLGSRTIARKGTHRHLVDADLGIVLLGLELELDVEAEHLGVLEALGLLLKTGIRKRLLEGDAPDEERVLHATAGHLLDADQVLIEVVLVEAEDGVDDHLAEEGLLRMD